MDADYLCETRLKTLDPDLHKRFTESVFGIQRMLNKYQTIFPNYTDHTALHSLEVIAFCNELIGKEQVAELNADELYVLLMSAYLHDSGMGISEKDYEEFRKSIDFGTYFTENAQNTTPEIIRDFHHEFSGAFIRKYGDIFDIPSKEHLFAIIQVSRGHRKTDLYDETEYPVNYQMPDGNTVCLPYLAAVIRLADELDIAADRNIQFLYDIDNIDNEFSRMEFKKHQAIRQLHIEKEQFRMDVDRTDEDVYQAVRKLKEKLLATLNECRNVVNKRTNHQISQKNICMNPV
ncbi:MAG: hypothetical protein ACI4HI_07800 [Lachnospiraceae bacterium]